MFKCLLVLLVVLGMEACASRKSIPPDDRPLSEKRASLKKSLPYSLPMHIFPTEPGKKDTSKKGEKKKLRVIDVPLGVQSQDKPLQMVVFPKTRLHAPSEPAFDAALPTGDSSLEVLDKRTDRTREDQSFSKGIVYFEHASSFLNDLGRDTLRQWVESLPESYPITITGYTDNQSLIPDGRAMNEMLAWERAEMIRDYLHSLGIDENRMTIKASPLCCYISSNETEAGRAKNRRAEICVVTEAPGTCQ